MNYLASVAILILIYATAPSVGVARQRSNPEASAAAQETLHRTADLRFEKYLKITRDYFNNRSSIRSAIGRANSNGAGETRGSAGVALFADGAKLAPMLMVMATIEITRTEINRARLEGKTIDSAELARATAAASAQVLDSFDLWTAFFASHALSSTLKGPLDATYQMIQTRAGRNFFSTFLQQSVGTTVGFLGWEAVIQLLEEARLGLSSEEDVQLAREITITGFTKSFFSNDPSLKKRRDVFFKILGNAGNVLFRDPEKLDNWIYHTWHHRLMTGHFVTTFAAMIAAGTLGAQIGMAGGPVISSITGFSFAVGGGVVTIFIPERIKDGITDRLKAIHLQLNDTRLNTNKNMIEIHLRHLSRDTSEPLLTLPATYSFEQSVNEIKRLLSQRRKHRSNNVNLLLYKLYTLEIHHEKATSEIKLGVTALEQNKIQLKAKANSNNSELQKLLAEKMRIQEEMIDYRKKQLIEFKIKTTEVMQQLANFYLTESDELYQSLYTYLDQLDPAVQGQVADLFNDEVQRLGNLNLYLSYFLSGLHPNYDVTYNAPLQEMVRQNGQSAAELFRASQVNLNIFYSFRYKESELLSKINAK